MELNGKVAWVVGASSGIGAAVARRLSSSGAQVAALDLQPVEINALIAGMDEGATTAPARPMPSTCC